MIIHKIKKYDLNSRIQDCAEDDFILYDSLEFRIIKDILRVYNATGIYYKRDKTLSSFFDCSERSIQRAIKNLNDFGFVQKVKRSNVIGGSIREIKPLEKSLQAYTNFKNLKRINKNVLGLNEIDNAENKLIDKEKENALKKNKPNIKENKISIEHQEIAINFYNKTQEKMLELGIKQSNTYDDMWAKKIYDLSKKYDLEIIEKCLNHALETTFFIKTIRNLKYIEKKWKNGKTAFETLHESYFLSLENKNKQIEKKDFVFDNKPNPVLKIIFKGDIAVACYNEFDEAIVVDALSIQTYRTITEHLKILNYNKNNIEYRKMEYAFYAISMVFSNLKNAYQWRFKDFLSGYKTHSGNIIFGNEEKAIITTYINHIYSKTSKKPYITGEIIIGALEELFEKLMANPHDYAGKYYYYNQVLDLKREETIEEANSLYPDCGEEELLEHCEEIFQVKTSSTKMDKVNPKAETLCKNLIEHLYMVFNNISNIEEWQEERNQMKKDDISFYENNPEFTIEPDPLKYSQDEFYGVTFVDESQIDDEDDDVESLVDNFFANQIEEEMLL